MKWRAILVVALALLTAGLTVRVAFVAAYASRNPARAANAWGGHPDVIFATGLEDIGDTAAAGKPVDRALVDRLLAASTKAPLEPEPFLVRGVQAQVAGDRGLAERAFLEARNRDPRSVVARYFLADHYVRTGQTRQGLGEISVLARLVPQSLDEIAPYLAAYARSPGGPPEVKAMLRSHSELEPLLLNALSADASNDRLVMFLWSGRGGDNARGWQERLLTSLVEAGRYEQARAAWIRFSPGSPQQGELVDPGFATRALPPFGWTLGSGAAGLAEPEGGGRLHLLYFGRDDFVLASQLILLKPGVHHLSMRVAGATPAAKSLAWTIRCLPASNEVAAISLGAARGGAVSGSLAIPSSGCPAQRLELAGTARELPQQADVTISELRLERGSGR